MNKKSLLLAVFALWMGTLTAQNKQLTLNDCVIGRYREFYPENISNLTWRPGKSDRFTFVTEDALTSESAKSGKTEILLNLSDLNTLLGESIDKELTRFPSVKWQNSEELYFRIGQTYYWVNVDSKTIAQSISFPKGAANLELNGEGNRLAYTLENNLYAATPSTEKITLSSEKNRSVITGQTVHRNEFGIFKGTFWSKKGNSLAFYRKDESMVKDYPLVDMMARQAEADIIKYPMAGLKSHQVTVGVHNFETNSTVWLKTGTPDEHYLTNVTWGPEGNFIYIGELNRNQNHLKWNKYDAETGNFVATLFEESKSTYVEPQHTLIFDPNNNNEFFYWTRRDGYFHLYRYTTEGKLIEQVTKGAWEITDVNGFDASGRYLFLSTTKDSPLDRTTYRLDLRTNQMSKINETPGTHSVKVSTSGNYVLDTYEANNVPRNIDLFTAKGKLVRNLLTADNPMTEFDLGENSTFTIKAADETTDLHCRMIKPTNFDPKKKYPVVVYVYGGPHAQLVTNRWHNGVRFWQYYMAQNGYVMFTVDSRGSANRGADFEEVIHRNLGITETADQMKGIEYLKSLPFVDANRIGVHGWSFGGFMTMNLMTRHADTFKVGVSGGGVVDWSLYEIMYGERYMDRPQENPEGYAETNMTNHVKDLEGKLMLIHGAQDNTVVMQHSYKFVRKCIEEGKQLDYFVYPLAEHNVRGIDRVHLMEKICNYFIDNL